MANPLNPTINVNPTPKQRFVAVSAYVTAHRDLIQRPEVQRAFDYALAQMLYEQSSEVSDGNSAAAGFYRMAGAQRFVTVLKELGETPNVPVRKPGEKEMPI